MVNKDIEGICLDAVDDANEINGLMYNKKEDRTKSNLADIKNLLISFALIGVTSFGLGYISVKPEKIFVDNNKTPNFVVYSPSDFFPQTYICDVKEDKAQSGDGAIKILQRNKLGKEDNVGDFENRLNIYSALNNGKTSNLNLYEKVNVPYDCREF